jgi:hypothetical protein
VLAAGRLDVQSLDSLVAGLSGALDLDFVAGPKWKYDSAQRAITYPPTLLQAMHARAAAGLVFRTTGHALFEDGAQRDPWIIAKIATQKQRITPVALITPVSALAIIRAIEEERVERMMRDEWPGLNDGDLPPRHLGYRSPVFAQEVALIRDPQPPGPVTSDGVALYWRRCALAIKALAAGGVKLVDLPPDIPWNANIVHMIETLCRARTFDALLDDVGDLITQLVRARDNGLSYWTAPPSATASMPVQNAANEPTGSNAADATPGIVGQQAPDCGGLPGPNTTAQSSSATPAPQREADRGASTDQTDDTANKDTASPPIDDDDFLFGGIDDAPFTQSTALGDNLNAEAAQSLMPPDRRIGIEAADDRDLRAVGLSPEKIRDTVLSVTDRRPGSGAGNEAANRTVPSIQALAHEASALTGSISLILRRALIANKRSRVLRPLRRGQPDLAAFVDFTTNPSDRLFRRRRRPHRLSYAVHLLADCSSSMNRKKRLDVARRLVAATTTACAPLEGVSIGGSIHDAAGHLILPQMQRPPLALRQRFLESLKPRGGTHPGAGFEVALAALRSAPATKRILIYLTDGDFNETVGQIDMMIDDLDRDGISTIILILGPSAGNRISGQHYADTVNEQTLAPILTHHLQRLV